MSSAPTIQGGSGRALLDAVERIHGSLADLARLLLPDDRPRLDARTFDAVYRAWVEASSELAGILEETTLRPLHRNAAIRDMPSRRQTRFGNRAVRRKSLWGRSMDLKADVTNVVGNEEYLLVESRVLGELTAPLELEGLRIGRAGAVLDLPMADVVRFENGYIAEVDRYYDFAGVCHCLDLISGEAAGHDEVALEARPLIHGAGFLEVPHEAEITGAPGTSDLTITIGRSDSAAAKTNVKNCTSIHEAFIKNDPQRFDTLIAEDSVWIDVPTGRVLNGAMAAAHHDHGNWQQAFPDSSADIRRLIGNDQWVVVQHHGYGTHTGVLQLGGAIYQPTGKSLSIEVLDVVGYSNGQAVLIRNYYDVAFMMRQLGIL